MLIVKGFLIKFNGVGYREVVLVVLVLVKMLIVMFFMIGEDNMKTVIGRVLLFGSCCL